MDRRASPTRTMEAEPRDPWLLCGPDTTVEEVWRVVERIDQATVYHLVFFDRHGWYCEHGRQCPAVGAVQRLRRALRDGRHRER